MMPPDENGPKKNPFVRFKEHVDAHIGAGLHNVFHVPSILAETVSNSRQLSPNDSRVSQSRHDESGNNGGVDNDDGEDDNDGSQSAYNSSLHFRAWLRGQQQAAAEEDAFDDYYERMMQDYRGSENAAVRDLIRSERFDTFAYRSVYSPINLANRMRRQPRPNDIDDEMDPAMFTYVDAFEDLMAEAAGVPMMDLRSRYNLNKLIHGNYPQGESPYQWIRRFESQGLLKAFYPENRYLPLKQPVLEHRVDEAEADQTPYWENTWESYRTQDTRTEKEQRPAGDGLFGEIDKVVRTLNQVLDDTIYGTGKQQGDNPREPHTENDLYNAVQSAFNEGQRSLSNFFKSLADGIEPRRRPEWEPEAASDLTDGDTVEDGDGTKTVKSTREYVDEYGSKHISTKIRRTNRDGTMVSTETHYSVRPATEAKLSSIEDSARQQDQSRKEASVEQDEKSPGEKHAGWFWK